MSSHASTGSLSVLGLLSCNAVLSLHKTWGLLWRHSYLARILRLVADEGSILPGSDRPLLKFYTGIQPLDRLIAISTVMLANVTGGTLPSFSLFGFYLSGQLLAIQCVIFVRAWKEKRSRYSAMLWLLLMQLVTYGDAMPFYCVHHLLTYKGHNGRASASTKRWSNLHSLPISISLGYIIPTIAMAIPTNTNALHQWFSGFWQGYPIWMILVQLFVESRSSTSIVDPKTEENRAPDMPIAIIPDRLANPRDTVDHVYRFAFVATVVTHLGSLGLITTNALFAAILHLYPGSSITFIKTFWPPAVTGDGSSHDMMSALVNFLQFDLYCGSMTSIIWAYVLFARARKGNVAFLCPALFMAFALGGPSAVILTLMWSLDASKADAEI